MTIAQLAKRLEALEKAVEQLRLRLDQKVDPTRPWWKEDAGRFKDDPIFKEMMELGAEYRRSLRPRPRKGKRDRA